MFNGENPPLRRAAAGSPRSGTSPCAPFKGGIWGPLSVMSGSSQRQALQQSSSLAYLFHQNGAMEIEIAARDLPALDGVHGTAGQIHRLPSGPDSTEISVVDSREHPFNDHLIALMDEIDDFVDIPRKAFGKRQDEIFGYRLLTFQQGGST